jgi:hypothetical protein
MRVPLESPGIQSRLATPVAVALLLLSPAAGQDAKPERLSAPEAAAQKDADKLIKDLFKEEYAKKTAADRIALAKKLLEQAQGTKDDAATRYVLLREANAVAAQAGELTTALKAADEMAQAYKVDGLSIKADTLAAAAKAAKTPDDVGRIANAYLKLSKEATDADDYAAADKATSAAAAQAKKGQNLLLINRAAARSKEVTDLKSRFDKLRKHKETLTSNPEDPVANLEIGQYECFTQGNWEVGLPLLAKGSDAALKDLAGRDLAGSAIPAEQATLGDDWWDLAEKRTGGAREQIRRRSALWYEKAVPKLIGLSLTKTDKRLVELRTEALHRGTWTDVSDPKLYGLNTKTLTVPAGEIVKLTKPPEGEFDGFTIRAKIPPGKSNEIRIEYEKGVRALVVYHKGGQVQSAKLEASTWRSEVMTLVPAKEEYLFTVLITDGEFVGYLDTKEFFRIPSSREAFSPLELHVFGSRTGEVIFDQVRLRKRQ